MKVLTPTFFPLPCLSADRDKMPVSLLLIDIDFFKSSTIPMVIRQVIMF